jgi:hypothetical protein
LVDQDEDESLGEQGHEDDLLHRKPVVHPARGKGEDDRSEGKAGDDEADLEAVEPELQEVEGGQEERGREGELPDEVDDMDLADHG